MSVKCEICGSETREFHDPQFNIDYYYCENCEFISRDRNKTVTSVIEKKEYDRHNNTYENEGYVNMFRNFLNSSMVPFASTGKDAFDFGSGPEPVMAKVLTDEYGYTTDIYDLFYSPEKVYEGKTYDVIVSTEVVEHLTDVLGTFRLFKSLLKEDGVLSVMTLFHSKDDEKFLKWFYRRDVTHISFFTPKTLECIAEIVGLEMVFCDGHRCSAFKHK